MRLLIVVLSVVALTHGLHAGACATMNATAPEKLPFNFVPSHYNLTLDLPAPGSTAAFEGAVSIEGVFYSAASCVVIHAGSHLAVTAAHINAVPVTKWEKLSDGKLVLYGDVPTGQATVSMAYTGTINDKQASGLFLSPNVVHESSDDSVAAAMEAWRGGKTVNLRRGAGYTEMLEEARARNSPMMLATQFEESDARNMFPCVDEPGYKATFEATITAPSDLVVLFNTEQKHSRTDSIAQRTMHTFAPTMNALPTYLIAVAVGQFDFLCRESKDVKYCIVTPPGYSSWAHLALNASVHAAEFFGEKYGLPYSRMNTKMDSISVAAIDMDAMENQGLLTYASQMLLLDPNPNASTPAPLTDAGRLTQAQLIVLVTTHEISHQWFGDTVTMRDWVQEYLNEGFARILQAYGSDDLVPEWDMLCMTGASQGRGNAFFQFSYEVAMTFDSPGTAPAIVYPLPGGGDIPPFPKDAASAEQQQLDPSKAPLFSRIFYEKGASVNRMVADHIGWDSWNSATGAHVRRFLWRNPTVEDLMRSLNAAFEAKNSPSALHAMLPWLQRPGYPVVTLDSAVEGQDLVLTLSQTASSKYLPAARAGEAWWVPLKGSAAVQCGSAEEVAAAFEFAVEFNEHTAVRKVAMPAHVVALLSTQRCAAANIIVAGNDRFLGPFIVRYNSSALWDARVAAVAGLRAHSPPDYVRETIFHAVLLAKMSHEKTSLPARMMSAVAAPLAANPKLGGMAGSGDLYQYLFKAGAYLGHSAATAATIPSAMRAVVAPLVKRLGWAANSTNGAGAVPWPTHEDAGVEKRAARDLRPVALLQAVVYNVSTVVEEALRRFKDPSALSAVEAPAVLFACVRHGSPQNYASVLAWYKSLQPGDMKSAALTALFGGPADVLRCNSSLGLLQSLPSTSAKIDALAHMIEMAPMCRDAALAQLVTQATIAWTAEGAGATQQIGAALSALASAAQLEVAAKLLKTQSAAVVPEDVARAILTSVAINVDMGARN